MNIIIAGDFCTNNRTQDMDFLETDCISKPILDLLQKADFSLVNLECPAALPQHKPIKKQGPCLKCTPTAIAYLKKSGFSGVTLANNHIMDYGELGLLNTLEEINKVGLEYVGAGTPADSRRQVTYHSIDNISIAFINCCENEFSVTSTNESGASPLDPLHQYYLIKEAKSKADYVIVIVHGGIEHFQHPTLRMKKTYRFFVDAGADVVINHHQHCYCGYEVYNNKPIFYGLGNFCFDWEGKRNCTWNEGYMVDLILEIKGLDFRLIPYVQCNDNPVVIPMDVKQCEFFNDRIKELNIIISDDVLLDHELSHYMGQTSEDYLLALEPYSSRVGEVLYRRGLLPSFVNEKRLLKLYDFVLCESHQERLVHLLKEKYKNLRK